MGIFTDSYPGDREEQKDKRIKELSEALHAMKLISRVEKTRIAGLEAELATEREHPTSILQCAACQRLAVVRNAQLVERAEQAEAELAERERMLRLAWEDFEKAEWPWLLDWEPFLADLRARAEK